jgi:uncharacterized membrane protein YeaQ/YmgE (transglycosylase-associated protein family)
MLELSPDAQHWVNVVLIWIGFGVLAGVLARAVLPAGDCSAWLATLTLGIVGSAVGLGVLSWAVGDRSFNPISPIGLMAATGGAWVLLAVYRVGSALFHKEPPTPGEETP